MKSRARFGWLIFFTLFVWTIPTFAAPRQPGDLRTVGKIDFPISCKPELQEEFARGVALLHSFFYEEARRIFTAVSEQDPKCAMAQWGIAMTWWHPIWTPPTPDEMKAGKAAIDKASEDLVEKADPELKDNVKKALEKIDEDFVKARHGEV